MMDPVDSSTFVPPPRVPPRGLVGLLDDYDPNATLDTSQFAPGEVFLNIYDLGGQQDETVRQINQVSMANNNMLLGGIFHAAVEVYGVEWSYGFNDRERSGISQIVPRTHSQHTYRSTVPLGVTSMGEVEVGELLERLANAWESNGYDPIHNNSLNFCHTLCFELGVGRIPGWVDRASRTASFLDQTSKTAAEGAMEAAEIARTVKNEVEQTVRNTLETVDEDALEAASEAIETLRRESIRAVEVVSAQTQELADALPVHAQAIGEQAQVLGDAVQQRAFVVGERVQQHGQVLGEAVQQHAQIMGEKAQEILGEDITYQAQEIAGKTKEHAQAFGRSLWSKAHELVSSPAVTGRSNDLWDSALGGLGLLGGVGGVQAQQQHRSYTQEGQQQNLFERAPMAGVPTDQKTLLVCRAGHALQPWKAEAGTCDGCGERIQSGQMVMDCRPCDWYLCGACCQRIKSGVGPLARCDAAAVPATAAVAAVTPQCAAAASERPAVEESQADATLREDPQRLANPAVAGEAPAEAGKPEETNIADDEQE